MTMVYCHKSIDHAIQVDDVAPSWQVNKRHKIKIWPIKAHVVSRLMSGPKYYWAYFFYTEAHLFCNFIAHLSFSYFISNPPLSTIFFAAQFNCQPSPAAQQGTQPDYFNLVHPIKTAQTLKTAHVPRICNKIYLINYSSYSIIHIHLNFTNDQNTLFYKQGQISSGSVKNTSYNNTHAAIFHLHSWFLYSSERWTSTDFPKIGTQKVCQRLTGFVNQTL